MDVAFDEVFVSDGAKCDVSNVQELFSRRRGDCREPTRIYPVYVDSNAMRGAPGPMWATLGVHCTFPATRKTALCRLCRTGPWT